VKAKKEEEIGREVGEKVTFPFGKGEMEGTVKRVFQKTVYITADFPKHKGKILKRSISALEQGPKKPTKSKTKSKAKPKAKPKTKKAE
jgi:hypothetical protein